MGGLALARDDDEDEEDEEGSSGDDGDEDVPSSDGGDDDDGLDAVLRRNQEGAMHRPRPGMVVDGKWELRKPLGKGSYGKVYEACHVKLDRAAAIKILDPKHGDPQMLKRFEEEARLQAQLESKHLVRVTDCGVLPDGSPYFVMDLVEGTSLRKVQRPLKLERALELAENMLAGLSELHRRGVTHGDIKPENIVIGEDGEARLTDFGLARTFADEPAAVGGTPLYMAPEMLLGDEPASASTRTDVYAAGVVMYELLTGKLPRGRLEMDKKRIRAELEADRRVHPVRMAMKEIPASEQLDGMEALDKLVMDAIARDPAMRPKSAVPMLAELQRLRRKLSPEALAPTLEPESGTAKSQTEVRTTQPFKVAEAPTKSVPRWVGVTVGVAALGVVVALAWWAWGGGPKPPITETPSIEDASPPVVAELSAEELADARGGILVVAGEDTAAEAYQAFCAALGGDGPRVEGVLPVACRRVPAMDAERLLALADQAEARVVVRVRGDRVEVRATSHHRGNPLLARLDGLELPAEPSRLAEVVPVLKVVMGASAVSEVELPRLEWTKVGARWGVLAEWVRLQQGHLSHEDVVHREQIERALEGMLAEAREREDGVAVAELYRDLAVHMRALSVGCDAAEPALRDLSKRGEHEAVVRIAALEGLVACLMEGDDAAAKADEAAALLVEAFEASGNDPCVRAAAIGSISRIDRWKGSDALWEAHAAGLPVSECEPALVSQAFAVRGEALAAGKRWDDAASAYARAYGSLATRVEPLLAWAEYEWLARPALGASRKELLDALRAALAAERFGQVEQQVSLAYMRWWLTREPADAQRVVDAYAAVKVGEVALIEGVASGLEPEICKGAKGDACSRRILVRPKRAGDEAALRRSLGVR